jgi:hypothetical protein
LRARSLLTVAAAICFARFVEAPCFLALSLMCSYCRSRFALHSFGMRMTSCWTTRCLLPADAAL